MAKMTLKDVQPKHHTFELVHPEIGETGGTITVRSAQSREYFDASLEMNKKYSTDSEEEETKTDPKETIKILAELNASAIVDWDEEFFGCKFSYDKAVELMQEPENFWIRNQIDEVIADKSNFFMKD